MICKCCGEKDAPPLFVDADGQPWFRCFCCGSDSAAVRYADVAAMYAPAYIEAHDRQGGTAGDWDRLKADMASNMDWFQDYRDHVKGRDFLDIGSCSGAALSGMQERGWSVHGFEVFAPPYAGPHVTVAPEFAASLFPQRYHAILAREVIEHVEGWRQFLYQCYIANTTPGLFQLQTPRPMTTPHPIPYQRGHLQILSPVVIRYWLERTGWDILDYRIYETGQCWMCKRVQP